MSMEEDFAIVIEKKKKEHEKAIKNNQDFIKLNLDLQTLRDNFKDCKTSLRKKTIQIESLKSLKIQFEALTDEMSKMREKIELSNTTNTELRKKCLQDKEDSKKDIESKHIRSYSSKSLDQCISYSFRHETKN